MTCHKIRSSELKLSRRMSRLSSIISHCTGSHWLCHPWHHLHRILAPVNENGSLGPPKMDGRTRRSAGQTPNSPATLRTRDTPVSFQPRPVERPMAPASNRAALVCSLLPSGIYFSPREQKKPGSGGRWNDMATRSG